MFPGVHGAHFARLKRLANERRLWVEAIAHDEYSIAPFNKRDQLLLERGGYLKALTVIENYQGDSK